MASTLTTSLIHSLSATLSDAVAGTIWNRSEGEANRKTTFQTGSAADLVNRQYESSRTLAISTSENIDLYDFDGATNAAGETYALSLVKIIIIRNTSASAATTITIGNAASNAWVGFFGGTTQTHTITKGTATDGLMIQVNGTGWAVADASNHKLKILNNSGSAAATYEIVVIGSQ
jgi:hypothetical protein